MLTWLNVWCIVLAEVQGPYIFHFSSLLASQFHIVHVLAEAVAVTLASWIHQWCFCFRVFGLHLLPGKLFPQVLNWLTPHVFHILALISQWRYCSFTCYLSFLSTHTFSIFLSHSPGDSLSCHTINLFLIAIVHCFSALLDGKLHESTIFS